MTVGSLLFGFRGDLDLSGRWWHRLLKVLGVLLLVAMGILVLIIVSAERVSATLEDVRIDTTLREFAKRSDPKVGNVIPLFLALPGHLGGISNGQIEFASEYYLGKSFCAADFVAHAKEYTDLINSSEYDASKRVAVEDVEKGLREERENRKPNEEIRYCSIDKDLGFESSEVVKYSYATLFALKLYGWMAGIVLAVVAGVAFIVMNLYYRGLVYIICGPRKREGAPTEIQKTGGS